MKLRSSRLMAILHGTVFWQVVVLASAAHAVEAPAGKWITKSFQFNSGKATKGRMYISVNPGAVGSIWVDNVRCDKLDLQRASFEDGLWSEGGRWGIWRLDKSKASDGAKCAQALYTADKKDKYARMQQKIDLKPNTSYTLSFDVFVGEDFVGQLGCSVHRIVDGKGVSAGDTGVKCTSPATAPKRYPEKQAPVPTQWQTMVPNGMLEFLNDDISGPWGWMSETEHARATWALSGVDGKDHRLVIEADHGGSGKWISAPLALEAGTEYVISGLYHYGREDAADYPNRMQVVSAATSKLLFDRPLSVFGSWQRLRSRFVAKEAGKVKVQLVCGSGSEVSFDEIMVMPADVAVHPQSPEDAAVTATSRPVLTWWHEDGDRGRYTVLIGHDPTVRRDVRRFAVEGAMQFTPPVDLPPGTWFWVVLPHLEKRLNEYAHKCLSEVRSFTIVEDRGEPADTTPPHLYRMRPALDSTTATNSPAITLKWLERGGSGIDPQSVKVLLDDKTPAQEPVIDDAGLKLTAGELAKGRHRVSVKVSDKAGNRSEASWQFYVDERAPSVTKLDANGWIIHNDLFFFPIGHYNYQYREVNMERDADYPGAGFNLVINCFNFDRALEWGLKGTQSTGANHELKTAGQLAVQLAEGLKKCHGSLDHPAYVGRWMDEAWKIRQTRPIFEAFRKIKKYHLMMPVGSGPWQIAHHPIQMIDILGVDHYPIGQHVVTNVIDMLQKLDKMRLPGQGLHYWAQAFDWYVFTSSYDVLVRFDYRKHFVENKLYAGHVISPTMRQMFAMAALGWVYGSQNAYWWGPATQKFPQTRKALAECARRSSWLGPVLHSNPPLKRAVCKTNTEHRIWLADKYDLVHFIEREYAGKRYLIAVNVNNAPVRATFTVPDLADDSPVKVLWENRRLQLVNGVFTDAIPGVGAVVYEY